MWAKTKFLSLLPALAFIVIMAAGFGSMVYSLSEVPAKEWQGMGEPAQLFGGESTRRFSKIMNDHFLMSRPFNYIERSITYVLTGDLGARVKGGRGDWLFLADELEIHAKAGQSAAARADIVGLVAQHLKEKNIRLQVVLIPDKTRIEAAELGSLRRCTCFANRVTDWVKLLQTQAVAAEDLTPVLASLRTDAYYHTDTHWNETGAQAAARELAAVLHAQDGAKGVIATTQTERRGDLIRLASLDQLPAVFAPKTEVVQQSTIPKPTVNSDDLFGDAGLPTIVLLGTSFSRNANFVPFLEYYLGEPVASVAKDGGDFDGSASSYFASASFLQNPPKTVIWEIPERVLQMPLKASEQQWLERLKRGSL
jgi:alginate O-acetyltransferase complex protein AlgJ